MNSEDLTSSKEKHFWVIKTFILLLIVLNSPVNLSVASSSIEITDEPNTYLDDELPKRAKPLLEWGDKFLGTGKLNKGLTLPGGAIWTPSLWVYGNFRTAVQSYDLGGDNQRVSEWANRFDLFFNLQLSGTERILLGLTPFRQKNRFSGYVFEPSESEGSINEFNADIDTLFFEGDFAELLPNLDYDDSSSNDYGFTIGRQRILFQDGFLVNDVMDGLGLSRNNIRFKGIPWLINARSSLFYAYHGVNRSDNEEDEQAKLIGSFTQLDTPKSTINLDLVYVDSKVKGDLLNVAFDSIQQIGKLSTTFRVARSDALGKSTKQASDGTLLFSEISWTGARNNNITYINAYAGLGNFKSASRGALAGGPLGRTGILFTANGLGSYPSPLDNTVGDSWGMAIGYQQFFAEKKRQLITELASRFDDDSDEYGIGFRYQQALGRRIILQWDGFITEDRKISDRNYGTRIEFQVKF